MEIAYSLGGKESATLEQVCILSIIFYYINPNKMHMLQSLFYLTTALHVSGVTITHIQEHKQL